MSPKSTIRGIRRFHVVGGGCFGSQYVRWLFRARQLGMVEFEQVIAVDRDPVCRLSVEGPVDPAFRLVEKDWVEYFSEYLLENFQNPDAQADHWVPAPLSPHILFLGFLKAASRFFPSLPFQNISFREDVKTPVQVPLQAGTYAVSFAEWQCPVNCIEPPACPAIHAPRDWDMKRALQTYFQDQKSFRSSHVLQCKHLVHGVGTIPCADIFSEFQSLLDDLSRKSNREITVATVSGCHGLIGAAEILGRGNS